MPQSGWAECRLIQYLRTPSSRRADTVRAAIQAPPGGHQRGLSVVPRHGGSAHGEPCLLLSALGLLIVLLLPGRPGSKWRAEGWLPRRRRRPT